MAFLDCDDPEDGDDMSAILEIIADRIRGSVDDVVIVRSVRVGKLMNMDEALEDIKAHIEKDKPQ